MRITPPPYPTIVSSAWHAGRGSKDVQSGHRHHRHCRAARTAGSARSYRFRTYLRFAGGHLGHPRFQRGVRGPEEHAVRFFRPLDVVCDSTVSIDGCDNLACGFDNGALYLDGKSVVWEKRMTLRV